MKSVLLALSLCLYVGSSVASVSTGMDASTNNTDIIKAKADDCLTPVDHSVYTYSDAQFIPGSAAVELVVAIEPRPSAAPCSTGVNPSKFGFRRARDGLTRIKA